MKNLKRIFSLALAGTMLAGMLTVGASAVTFTDAEDIKNNDAVNFMVALNIINGKDDGSFDPEATVTRAEMAKMITIALNGGREPVLGTKATPSFTDIKGNWAEKYIEYCANLGIIGGRGNGTFDPTGTVTGTEAAKMILVAMGYDSTVFNFTGADWAINVNTEANNATPNKLYKGLETIDPNAGLSRDNAAQMIFNGVQDHIMEKSPSLTITNGEITYGYNKMDGTYNGAVKTILSEKYGYLVEYGYMTGASYDEDAKAYDYTIDSRATMGGAAIDTKICFTNGRDNKTVTSGDVTFADDVSNLFGQQVKVVYDADDMEAVGIYAANSEILATVVAGKLPTTKPVASATSMKINGTTYRFDGDPADNTAAAVDFYDFLGTATGENMTNYTVAKENLINLIDNDGDGRINCVVVHPVQYGKISYKGSETITIDNSIGNFDLDDVNLYEGAKKGDYVVVTNKANTVDGKTVIAEAEVIEGTVTRTKNGSNTEVQIDGTWYEQASTTLNGSATVNTGILNDEAKVVLVNGYYVYVETISTASSDLLVIYQVGNSDTFGDVFNVRAAFSDGTTKVIKAKLKSGTDLTDGANRGILYAYSVDKEGVYTLTDPVVGTPAANETKVDFDGKLAVGSNWNYNAKSKRLVDASTGEKFIADDAVVFILHKDSSISSQNAGHYVSTTTADKTKLEKLDIISGKDLKTWDNGKGSSDKFGTPATTTALYDTVNGLDYVKVLFLSFDRNTLPGAGGDMKFGYIVSDSYRENVNDTVYTHFDVWTGSDTVSVFEEGTTNYDKRTAIAYKDLGNGEVEVYDYANDAATPGASITQTAAVVGYNANDKIITLKTGASAVKVYEIDEKTNIIYINSEDGKGAESDGIELATELASGAYEQNVIFQANSDDDHVDAIFVDVNNKVRGSAAVIVPAAAPESPVSTVDGDFAGKAEGVYMLDANKANHTWVNTTCSDLSTMLFFNFNTTVASDVVTLTIKSGNTVIYSETATVPTAGVHAFYVDHTMVKLAAGATGTKTALVSGTTYTYTITSTGAGDATKAISVSGSFSI